MNVATPLLEREPTARSGTPPDPTHKPRASTRRRAKQPVPTTRREAEELWRPTHAYASAHGGWLYRMNRMGLFAPDGRRLTNLDCYHAILDALYPCDPGATEERDTPSPTA